MNRGKDRQSSKRWAFCFRVHPDKALADRGTQCWFLLALSGSQSCRQRLLSLIKRDILYFFPSHESNIGGEVKCFLPPTHSSRKLTHTYCYSRPGTSQSPSPHLTKRLKAACQAKAMMTSSSILQYGHTEHEQASGSAVRLRRLAFNVFPYAGASLRLYTSRR